MENCLSGFNSSIFAYGQTGSGKTYTMIGELPCGGSGSLPADVGSVLYFPFLACPTGRSCCCLCMPPQTLGSAKGSLLQAAQQEQAAAPQPAQRTLHSIDERALESLRC